jgi:hypothetical protein
VLISLAAFLQISISLETSFVQDEKGSALSFLQPMVVVGKDGWLADSNTTNRSQRRHLPPANSMHLWTTRAEKIIQASRHPKYDQHYKLYNITRDVFHTITPRLDLAIRALPLYNHQQMTTILDKLQQRRNYLKSSKETQSPPPPLRLLIMGGSVARGLMCNTGMPGYLDDTCSWVERLDLLLNFDYETGQRYPSTLVDIHSTAVGGWNTYVSNAVLDYDLIEDDAWLHPDIVINAHATNEMHVNTVQAARARNQTHFDFVFEMTQRFIRTVLKKCMVSDDVQFHEPPLLIYFDDYLGNDQRRLMDMTTASQATHVLAKYYGVGYVSYADAVRDIVLRDTHEQIFSPQQWYKAEHGDDVMLREVHPNFGMHIASSMIMTYYFWTVQTHVEATRAYYEHHHGHGDSNSHVTTLTKQRVGDTTLLPPRLDRSLLLDHVSDAYKRGERRTCGSHPNRRRCPVAWLIEASSGADSINATMAYFRPYMPAETQQEWGWFNQGGRKRPRYGFTPVLQADKQLKGHEGPGTNRTMTLTFDYRAETRGIRSVTVFYLQKNQTKWKGTEMSVSVHSLDNQALVAETKVSNYNNAVIKDDKVKTTIELAPPQRHFKVEFKHTGGVTFRMTGLAICE